MRDISKCLVKSLYLKNYHDGELQVFQMVSHSRHKKLRIPRQP